MKRLLRHCTALSTASNTYTYAVIGRLMKLRFCLVVEGPHHSRCQWKARMTIPSAVMLSFGLSLYWSPGVYLIIPANQVSPVRAFVATVMHTWGVVLMMCADKQKYFVLQLKKAVIEDGWVAWCRNTNYLGEILVYTAYAILSQHWFPWVVNVFSWTIVFASSIAEKDLSFRRKVGGEEYVEKAGLLLPNVAGWAWDAFLAPQNWKKVS
ncbi:Steroid 5-alpha reductase, C-terminal [Seminavis robusta]|uniref:Steroid 5-alpha reductase, C-terminal n=1 Tax=Seminavis robusta TaxID=568900 RepID=A0A9N8EWF4_9STRA|nr:Steroid 5-alpha reductase, C-terminal [Seminavis robusta]|eukprot:Sro1805_g298790.1 Steroid 5-alpha reductase, C-terminal (209) ;mRNA; r:9269-9895